MNRLLIAVALVLSSLPVFSASYPTGPDQQLTPGDVCIKPSYFRYPEQISYCVREVSTEAKQEVIKEYDQNLGYSMQQIPRNKFKIDHFIPLCMGGSNEKENLWPQHESVYVITDPLEQEACQKMAQGRFPQVKAIELIKYAKSNLNKVTEVRNYVRSL